VAQVSTDAPAVYDYATHYVYTGEARTISWCQPNLADYPGMTFEIEVEHFETGSIVVSEAGLTDTTYFWTPPQTGHYIVRIRNTWEGITSEWMVSNETRAAEGTCTAQDPWWMFAWIAPPGGPIEL